MALDHGAHICLYASKMIGEAIKPVCPMATQVALEPDLVDHWLTWIN